MKNTLKSVFLVVLIFTSSSFIYTQNRPDGAHLEFRTENHNYGKIHIENIPEGKLNIEFTNEGNRPLVLSNVRACCGTRVIEWPQQPILPGQGGVIKIEFQIQPRVQTISRTVTVMSNAVNSPDIFRILGEVTEEREQLINTRQ